MVAQQARRASVSDGIGIARQSSLCKPLPRAPHGRPPAAHRPAPIPNPRPRLPARCGSPAGRPSRAATRGSCSPWPPPRCSQSAPRSTPTSRCGRRSAARSTRGCGVRCARGVGWVGVLRECLAQAAKTRARAGVLTQCLRCRPPRAHPALTHTLHATPRRGRRRRRRQRGPPRGRLFGRGRPPGGRRRLRGRLRAPRQRRAAGARGAGRHWRPRAVRGGRAGGVHAARGQRRVRAPRPRVVVHGAAKLAHACACVRCRAPLFGPSPPLCRDVCV